MGAARDPQGDAVEPTREEVVAELLLFIRETVRELGEFRATGFLKKFYGWYLGRGRFPKPFKQELVSCRRSTRSRRGCSRPRLARPRCWSGSRRSSATVDEVLLDSLPISIYGGG